MPNGVCIYHHAFKINPEIEPQLVSGGFTGIFSLIQLFTRSQSRIKIVEQEEMTILFEHGKIVSAALITEKNLDLFRNQLKKLIQVVEEDFREELKLFNGNITRFRKIRGYIKKFFEIKDNIKYNF
ncbi:MAG: hypothetical protein ACFFDN_32315 [Candidatus Hodarchaeota archaeon]